MEPKAGKSGRPPRWERRCIKRLRKGDASALAELYEAYASPVFAGVLLPKLGDRQAAEDALGETFRVVLERIDQYDDQGVSVWYWIARIASNKAMDMHRAKARSGRALTSFEDLLAPLVAGPQDPEAAVGQRAEAGRVKAAVGDVLARLNPRYRRAIELRFFEERSREECAEALEVKLGTFDVVLLRALRSFKKAWGEVMSQEDEL